MLRSLFAIATVTAMIALGAPARAADTAPALPGNPLLAAWTGPHGGVPPLDQVRVEHFAPALQAGMALQRREIAAITANPAPPSFDNTVLALERSGALLQRARRVYFLWTSSLKSPAMQALERQMQPQLAAFNDELNQNRALFERIEAVYQSQQMKRLTPEQQRLAWSYRTAFVKQGARLEPEAKRRVAEINQKLAALQTQFAQNLLADEQKAALVITDPAELAGLTPADTAAFAQEALRRGLKDRWVVANTRSAVEPFLVRSTRRELREQAWRAWTGRGDNGDASDNKRIVSDTLALRAERSSLMGFASYAHWKLSDTMARDPKVVTDLLLQVWRPAVEQLRKQIAEEQKLADAESAAAGRPPFAIQGWDLRHYAEKLRKAQYDFDTEELSPYLQLDKVREAMFWAAGRLYGLRFEPVQGVPVFHPDVAVWRVLGRGGEFVGLWYFDPFARDGKNSGAWMASYRPQNRLQAPDVRPLVSNNSNFRRGNPGEPVQVSWEDAVTMFHEFGHALHGLLSNVSYPRLAGPFSVSDFGEVPSMVNEYWLPTAPVLGRLVDTANRPLPPALVDKLLRSQNFAVPFDKTEFVASAVLDMRLHQAPGGAVPDPKAFEQAVLAELGMPAQMVPIHRIPHFRHIFSSEGYASGYYGYLWAEVLARDLYGAFLEAGDPFDQATAKRYLTTMLSVGNMVDPAEGFKRFRGRGPSAEHLLRALGLAP